MLDAFKLVVIGSIQNNVWNTMNVDRMNGTSVIGVLHEAFPTIKALQPTIQSSKLGELQLTAITLWTWPGA